MENLPSVQNHASEVIRDIKAVARFAEMLKTRDPIDLRSMLSRQERKLLDFANNREFRVGTEDRWTILKGSLDLSRLEIPVQLIFVNCEISDHISFAYAKAKSLHFLDCSLSTFDGIGLTIDDDLSFCSTGRTPRGLTASGTIRLTNARIGKRLTFNGGSFREGPQEQAEKNFDFSFEVVPRGAIDAGKIHVGSSVRFQSVRNKDSNDAEMPFKAQGLVSFRGATVGGRVSFSGAKLQAGRSKSYCESCSTSNDFATSVELLPTLFGFRLPEDLEEKVLENRKVAAFKFINRHRQELKEKILARGYSSDHVDGMSSYILSILSLDFYSSQVVGRVIFERCHSNGTIRLGNSNIQGKLSFRDCILNEVCPPGDILDFRASVMSMLASIAYNYFASLHLLPHGAVDCTRAQIGGSVYLINGNRLVSDSRRDPLLQSGGVCYGRVSFPGSSIGGVLALIGVNLIRSCGSLSSRKKSSSSIELNEIVLEKSLIVSDKTYVLGTFLLSRATIKARIILSDSVFVAAGQKTLDQDDALEKICIDADNLTCHGEFRMQKGCVCRGVVNLESLRSHSSVIIEESLFYYPNDKEIQEGIFLSENLSSRPTTFPVRQLITEELSKDIQDESFSNNKPVLINLAFSEIGHSLRFSSANDPVLGENTEFVPSRSCILGTVTVESAKISSELDICAGKAHASALDLIRRQLQIEKNSPPCGVEEFCSLLNINLTSTQTRTLRTSEDLPAIGQIKAEGVSFQYLAGQLLSDRSNGYTNSRDQFLALVTRSGKLAEPNEPFFAEIEIDTQFAGQVLEALRRQSHDSFSSISRALDQFRTLSISSWRQDKGYTEGLLCWQKAKTLLQALPLIALLMVYNVVLLDSSPFPVFELSWIAIPILILCLIRIKEDNNEASLVSIIRSNVEIEALNRPLIRRSFLLRWLHNRKEFDFKKLSKMFLNRVAMYGYTPILPIGLTILFCLYLTPFYSLASQSGLVIKDGQIKYQAVNPNNYSDSRIWQLLVCFQQLSIMALPSFSIPIPEYSTLPSNINECEETEAKNHHSKTQIPLITVSFVLNLGLIAIRLSGWLALTVIITAVRRQLKN